MDQGHRLRNGQEIWAEKKEQLKRRAEDTKSLDHSTADGNAGQQIQQLATHMERDSAIFHEVQWENDTYRYLLPRNFQR